MVVARSSGPRVRAVIGVHQPAEVDVRVALRGGEARVTEQLLDGAQVGARPEEVGREGVAERVGRRLGGRAAREHVGLHEAPHAPRGQPPAARVQEDRAVRDRETRLGRAGAVGGEGAERRPPDRHDPLLASLAEDAEQAGVLVHVLPVEADELAHAQPRGVEHLEERAAAQPGERVAARRGEQPVDVVERQVRGQLAARLRRGDAEGRVGGEPPPVGEEAEEPAHRGELARDRRALGRAVEGAEPVADGIGPLGAEMRGVRREHVLRPCRHAGAMVSTDPGRNKVRMRHGTARALALSALLLAGCRAAANTPRGTAERFLDAHYVRIDLPAALEFTADLARHKVENEMQLVQGQTIDETTRKPSVHYRLLEEHPEGAEAVRYLYHGSIAIEDADRLERRWLVTVRFADGSWRVTNYEEFEG